MAGEVVILLIKKPLRSLGKQGIEERCAEKEQGVSYVFVLPIVQPEGVICTQ